MTYKIAQPWDEKTHMEDMDDTENTEMTHNDTSNGTTKNISRDSDTIKMTHYIVQLAQNDTL